MLSRPLGHHYDIHLSGRKRGVNAQEPEARTRYRWRLEDFLTQGYRSWLPFPPRELYSTIVDAGVLPVCPLRSFRKALVQACLTAGRPNSEHALLATQRSASAQ